MPSKRCRITFLEGKVDDDYHVICEEFWRDGRRYDELRELVARLHDKA